MDERALVSAIRAPFAAAGVLAERGDEDTAPLPVVPPGWTRVMTTDMAVEGKDFTRAWHGEEHAGVRAMVQNLSDLAAAGAAPVGFVWSLAIPDTWTLDAVAAFAGGAARASALGRCPLLGGDLSSTDGPLTCAITALGDVQGAPLTRHGARVGDRVCLSGPTGASAAGLRALREGRRDAPAVLRHLEPQPALALGRRLVGVASACIDVSDGLLLDLARLAERSGVAFELPDLRRAVDVQAGASETDALGGGEDWVLAFTAPPGLPLPESVLCLGRVVQGQGLWADGLALSPQGFDHFAR